MRKTNDAGIELIKEFEGVKPKAYLDPIGILTVGVGHVVQPADQIKLGQVISGQRVDALLRQDLVKAEAGVEAAITEDITDNQFAACVSLAFNIGVAGFRKSSIVKFINAGDALLAADRFLLYNKAGGKVLAGLTRRRKAERALFLTDDEEPAENEDTESATVAKSTTTTTTTDAPPAAPVTVVEEKSSLISTVTGNEKVKEIAGTGLSTIGTRLATGGISGGALAAVSAFLEKAWPLLIFAGVLLVLGVAIWMLVYHNKQKEKQMTAAIAADPTRQDIKFK